MAQKNFSSHKAEERGVAVATASDSNIVKGKFDKSFAKVSAGHYTSVASIANTTRV